MFCAKRISILVLFLLLVVRSQAQVKTQLVLTEAPASVFVGQTATFVVRLEAHNSGASMGEGFTLQLYDGGSKISEKITLPSGRVRFTVAVQSYGSRNYTVKFFSPNTRRWTSTRLDVPIVGRLAQVQVSRKLDHGGLIDSVFGVTLTVRVMEIDGSGRVIGPVANVLADVGMAMMAGPGRNIGGGKGLTDSQGMFVHRYILDLRTYGLRLGDQVVVYGSMSDLFRSEIVTTLRV